MTENRIPDEEDLEGHRLQMGDEEPQDDVEGHRVQMLSDEGEDDVEGHSRPRI